MLYGKPIKHVRHVDHDNFTVGPQRFYIHRFWRTDTDTTVRSDGDDIQDDKGLNLGSKIKKHKVEILVTPETIEPQQLYIGRVKLSFNDYWSNAIAGMTLTQASYQGTITEAAISNAITPNMYCIDSRKVLTGDETEREIGGAASGYGIAEWMLDDHIKHWINLKKVTVFDQRPLMGERWQRIPSKVKRANDFSYYGLFIFNDSPRGGTPADTQVTVDIKSYWEELAL